MASRYKYVTIRVANNELEAMEDIIVAKLPKREFLKKQHLAIHLWKRIVRDFDGQKRVRIPK